MVGEVKVDPCPRSIVHPSTIDHSGNPSQSEYKEAPPPLFSPPYTPEQVKKGRGGGEEDDRWLYFYLDSKKISGIVLKKKRFLFMPISMFLEKEKWIGFDLNTKLSLGGTDLSLSLRKFILGGGGGGGVINEPIVDSVCITTTE